MFFVNWDETPIKNTKKVEMTCSNCGNDVEHEIFEVPTAGIGLIFFKKPLLALKKYYLVCPKCHNATKEINKEQVKAHKLS